MGLTSLKLSAGVALLVGGFATQNALADSYVFVTNTTPQTVSLQINQTGTHILEQGNEWAQEATQIAPYETKRVLRINRYTGLKSGKTYNFDTVVSTGNSQVTLKQTMTGTWSGSTIKHGIQTATTTSPWYSDRDVPFAKFSSNKFAS